MKLLTMLPLTVAADIEDGVDTTTATYPARLLRLWSVIDVRARVRRAAAVEAAAVPRVCYLSGDAVA